MKQYEITVNGQAYHVTVKELNGQAEKSVVETAPATSAESTPTPTKGAPAGEGISVTAPMPGTILEIKLSVGDSVKAGTPLMVLEAMKMENDIVAPKAGKITSIHVKKGDTVAVNDLLATVAEE